jgi:hypothetical protein
MRKSQVTDATDRREVHICDPQTRPDEHQLMIPQAREVFGTVRNCLPRIFAGVRISMRIFDGCSAPIPTTEHSPLNN